MPKKNRARPPREITKRQLARWQQERRRQRVILGIGILVIVAAVVIVGTGAYLTSYRPLHQTIVTVNNVRFNMNYYINMLRYYNQNQPASQAYTIAGSVASVIERNELVRQAASQLGITVKDDEADKEMAKRKLGKQYRDLVRYELLVNKLLDGYFDAQVPATADQRQVQAMFLESERQVPEVTAKLATGKDFGELAGELSLDSVSKAQKGNLGWHSKDIFVQLLNTPVVADHAFDSEIGVLSPPLYDDSKTKNVGYWLAKILEKKEDASEVHLQAILLGSEEQANQVRAQLEAGEDFAKLAGEFSQLDKAKENGGDLGWVRSGTVSPALDNYLFKSEAKPQALSKPIRDDKSLTKGGYWLVKVLAKDETRKIDEEDRKLLKGKAFNDWLVVLKADPDNKIENLLDDEKISFAVKKATESSR